MVEADGVVARGLQPRDDDVGLVVFRPAGAVAKVSTVEAHGFALLGALSAVRSDLLLVERPVDLEIYALFPGIRLDLRGKLGIRVGGAGCGVNDKNVFHVLPIR